MGRTGTRDAGALRPHLPATGTGRSFPPSQRKTYDHLERHQPGRHTLTIIPGYAHADVFIGRRAHVDVFPGILTALSA